MGLTLEDKAFSLAIHYHKGQSYGKYDYSYHLSAVAGKVDELHGEGDGTIHATAWLHDILEDTDCEYETIGHACGWKVADAVVSVTKIKGESYKDYIKRVRENDLGLKVKIADTLCNLEESIKINDMKRVKKYSKQIQLLCE